MMFEALAREETLASRVREQLEKLVLESRLQPGDRLPAERELALQFGVSRTVIREAVMALVAQGLLDGKHGSGRTIRTPSVASISPAMALMLKVSDLDHAKVIEVRRLLEVEIAGLAAERRTAADLEKLREILEDRKGIERERDKFVSWDIGFHSALAACTHNELFSLLLDSVVSTMKKVREIGFNVPGTPRRALAHHRAIFAEVKAGDGTGARQAMREHLRESEETMTKGLKRKK
jgi:GntR family transcriptional repressor for pyruvate dehydrogenase complex